MTGRLDVIAAVTDGSVPAAGLPDALSLAEVRTMLGIDDQPLGTEPLGESNSEALRWSTDSDLYQGGLFVYTTRDDSRNDTVLLVAGFDPFDDTLEAPESDEAALAALGPPELVLDAALGGLMLSGAERVWPARGLAVRTNPANDLLLAILVFAPTTAADYVSQIRLDAEPRRWMAETDALGLDGARS